MKKEIIGKCPVCHGNLEVQKLHCSVCDISIEGNFTLCKFCTLPKEQKEFAEVFIKNRGNIKEIEKELGISYPTVKGKLEALINSLGYKPQTVSPEINKKNILERLDRGEITSEQALKLLNGQEEM